MQNKKSEKTRKIQIQKTLTGVITITLFTLTIPALSLIKIPQEEKPTFTIKFDMALPVEISTGVDTSTGVEVSTGVENEKEGIIEVVQKEVPNGITQEEYDNNNFYLIQDYKTGEVLTLTPTEYIKGVVSAEMPISFHDEALKAQAITAHSYALRQIENTIINQNNDLNGAYLSNDPSKYQACFFEDERIAYWNENFVEYEEKLDNIVKEVITQIAVVENEPIIGAFHAISNGVTETAEEVWGQAVSYLISTPSYGDQYAPNYEATTTLTASEIETSLKKVYPNIKLDTNKNNWFTQIQVNESGRISSINVGDIELTGHELRTILNLRSASFDISVEGEEFTFQQTGYGHGVGLSQYGADYMARQGNTYDEILKHYYSGVDIVYLQ